MASHTPEQQKLAQIIIDALDLEDLDLEEFAPDMALFGIEGDSCLGLDSIDALEIALAISQNYGVQIKSDDENNREIFTSLKTLSDFVQSKQP